MNTNIATEATLKPLDLISIIRHYNSEQMIELRTLLKEMPEWTDDFAPPIKLDNPFLSIAFEPMPAPLPNTPEGDRRARVALQEWHNLITITESHILDWLDSPEASLFYKGDE